MKNDKISENNKCFDGLVGIKGCGEEYDFYLDDYGFSLKKGTNIVDDSYSTAKNLINTLIAQSIDDTIKDITFNDFQANKILLDVELGVVGTNEFTGTKNLTFTLNKYCNTLGQFFSSDLEFYCKTAGTNTTITLIENGTETVLYNQATESGTLISIGVNRYVTDTFALKIETDEIFYNYSQTPNCGCLIPNYNLPYYTLTSTDEGLTYGKIDFQVRCNKVKYLCKYRQLLAPSIINATMGKLYYQHYTTDTFSNYLNSLTDEKILSLCVFYDSNYINLVNTERNPNEKKGQYQLELEKLNRLIPQPKCNVCVECGTTGWVETINIP